MESQSLGVLRTQASDPREHADVRQRMGAHLRVTERHVERIRDALRALGSAPHATQTHVARLPIVEPVTDPFFPDLVKKALARFAAEQFEVAAYTALIAAAEHAGEPEVARLCRLNRGEDEEMAEWLDAQIPIVITSMLRGLNRVG